MSKFFASGRGASSDSESESSEDEIQEVKGKSKSAFRGDDFDFMAEGEDDQKRVVRAQKDKKFDELKDIIKQIKNAKNNKDLNKMLSGFDELLKAYDKSKTVFLRQNISFPRFYIRAIADIEDFLNNLWEDKEAKSALSKVNSKALPNLRQKVRKYVKEVETKLAEYRKNPDPAGYETPEEESAAVEGEIPDEIEENVADQSDEEIFKKAPKEDRASGAESDSSWDLTDDDSIADSDDDTVTNMEQLRRHFLKKEFRDDKGGKKDEKQRKQRAIKVKEVHSDDDWIPVSREKTFVLFEAEEDITNESLLKKLTEIISVRGRKGTDRNTHLQYLTKLHELAIEENLTLGVITKVNFSIISALFELNSKISDHMDFTNFVKTLEVINGLLEVLSKNPNVLLSMNYTDDDENLTDDTQDFRVQGSILIAIQRLDLELTKVLQNADCHSNDYIEKLKGEKDMCTLLERAEAYVEKTEHRGIFSKMEICKLYMTRVEHVYYKYKEHHEGEEQIGVIIDRLCKKIYLLDDEKRMRQRAILCHVYWLALHDEWHRARDLLLMSHMQAIVDHSDIDTQILYNRTICQVGLCAFRHGFINQAHQALSEIQNTQRAKELLAQSIGIRQHERTAEQEKVDRSRQVPYHMHINVELMECVYLICSMLLEIPHMASSEFEMRRKLLSRSYHYQLKQSEKASLIGPPENTREHVVAASRAMLAGDWKKCRDYIVNEKMDVKVWKLFRNPEPVKTMVVRHIQVESLRTYLLMYSTVYSTVSLKKLADLFELDGKDVHSIISKMIIQEELSATLDEPTDCLIMHRVEPSRLQMLAMNLTEKLYAIADNNEQILEPRMGRSGPNAWFPGRNERQGDKQKGDRRAGGQSEGGKRGGGSGGSNWNNTNNAQRRRDQKQRGAF